MAEFVHHLHFVRALNIPYIYNLGNHDMYKPNDSKYHALQSLKGTIKDFTVVDEIQDIDGITYVPYQINPLLFPTKTLDICVAHQTFKGADFGDITTQEGVDAESIEAYVIISGHIHKRQSLGRKVIYPGSPFSQSASDVNQCKGLLLFDTDTLGEQFISCPLPMWKSAEYRLEQGTTTGDVHRELIQLLPGSQDHWQIHLAGPKSEIVEYQNSTEYKGMISGLDVKIKPEYTDKEKRKVEIKALSMEQIISEWVAKVYTGSLDRVELENKARETLDAVRHTKL